MPRRAFLRQLGMGTGLAACAGLACGASTAEADEPWFKTRGALMPVNDMKTDWLDGDYAKRWGVAPVRAYGQGLARWRNCSGQPREISQP
jgi:hypothetical protein